MGTVCVTGGDRLITGHGRRLGNRFAAIHGGAVASGSGRREGKGGRWKVLGCRKIDRLPNYYCTGLCYYLLSTIIITFRTSKLLYKHLSALHCRLTPFPRKAYISQLPITKMSEIVHPTIKGTYDMT